MYSMYIHTRAFDGSPATKVMSIKMLYRMLIAATILVVVRFLGAFTYSTINSRVAIPKANANNGLDRLANQVDSGHKY